MAQFNDIAELLATNIRCFPETESDLEVINAMISSTSGIDGDCGFFIVDLSVVIKKYQQWCEMLPRVKPFYAVKSNPDPRLINVLAILGANFDCASKSEIEQVLSVCSSDRIIFANPAKIMAHLRFARSVDVNLMTFDNWYEFNKISLFHPDANLVLRIQVDDSFSKCQFNDKFGAKMSEVDDLLTRAKIFQSCTNSVGDTSEGLSIVGVSFHVGSGCMNVAAFDIAIARCREVFDIAKSKGYNFTLLDIGGGFPGSDIEGKLSFEAFAKQINESLEKYFPEDEDNPVTIIAEPGRYFCSASHTLVLNIVAKNVRIGDDGKKTFMYTVNDGVYGSLNCIMFDHAVPVIKPFNERDGETYDSIVYGPTCDSMDTICKCKLPNLAIGECIYIENCGAYSSAAASQFNGFKRTPSEYIMRKPT